MYDFVIHIHPKLVVYNMQMKGISCEIDEEYFLKGKERIEKLQPIQATMFD